MHWSNQYLNGMLKVSEYAQKLCPIFSVVVMTCILEIDSITNFKHNIFLCLTGCDQRFLWILIWDKYRTGPKATDSWSIPWKGVLLLWMLCSTRTFKILHFQHRIMCVDWISCNRYVMNCIHQYIQPVLVQQWVSLVQYIPFTLYTRQT